MQDPEKPKGTTFTAFRSAAEEVDTKRQNELTSREDTRADDPGDHTNSTGGRVMRIVGAELPYVVILAHHGSEATKHGFRTMREAEAFIKRKTPLPRAVLSTTYDQPASETRASASDTESIMNDEAILARLKSIDRRLRQMTAEDAASVLAGGLASAGISGPERLRLLAETERILDQLDGTIND